MIKILLSHKPNMIDVENKEQQHLDFLLFMKSAQKFLIRSVCVLGDEDWHNTLEKFYHSLPDETTNECGYRKNLESFSKVRYLITYVLTKETYKLAMETEAEDLPKTKGLEFLKVKSLEPKCQN